MSIFANNISNKEYLVIAREGSMPLINFPSSGRGLPFMAGIKINLIAILIGFASFFIPFVYPESQNGLA